MVGVCGHRGQKQAQYGESGGSAAQAEASHVSGSYHPAPRGGRK
ncbi:hypothetical protein A176_004908 [Myxococcus hansupus]|uniref:Uncharacterized protein n=1 Tax=Pseudomyxococcus hansupus TaxID=1297742 RepID=A0A0H4WX82_9BACT|nr:hypothetical protein A176_004908 [Myxococcus hansupus]